MTDCGERWEFREVAALLAGRSGLDVQRRDVGMFEWRVRERMRETGCGNVAAYQALLAAEEEERARLDEALRVGETRFFRDREQFAYLRDVWHAETFRRLEDSWLRSLHLLSVGCSDGAEVWSLAITMASLPWPENTDWRIRGLDLSVLAVARARNARYSLGELRGLDEDVRNEWFVSVDGEYCVRDSLRARVSFEQANVLDADFASMAGRPADVVFFKNVLIYLHSVAARRALDAVAARVRPGGLLMLAPCELQGNQLGGEFMEIYQGRTGFYRRRTDAKGGGG